MSGFSAEELAAINDAEVVDAVLGVVWGSVAGMEEAEVAEILQAAPEGFGVVHSVYLLDAEVQNGGFHQYFWNTQQLYVPMLKRSLASLAATDHLALLEFRRHCKSWDGNPWLGAAADPRTCSRPSRSRPSRHL